MGGRDRYAYMGRPGFNPPNDHCPDCTEPSKIYLVGGKTVEGVAQYRYRCEHHHEWILTEKLEPTGGS